MEFSMNDPQSSFESGPDYIQSLTRGLAALRSFDKEHPSLTISELAERTGLSRAVARRCLLTLGHLGYVGSQGRNFFLLPKVLELGTAYMNSLSMPELALPWMEAMAGRIQESTSLSVLDGQDLVYVARVPVHRVMTIALNVGARLPVYATSMGRVLLSGLEDAALDERIAGAAMRPLTPNTLRDRGDLKAEILRVRERGYAMVVEELQLGLCSMAVPVRNQQGRVAAALNAGVQARPNFPEWARNHLLPELLATAAAIESSLRGYRWVPSVR
jgi:IclR family transcriptional regulator, pca regulon regulatory protein